MQPALKPCEKAHRAPLLLFDVIFIANEVIELSEVQKTALEKFTTSTGRNMCGFSTDIPGVEGGCGLKCVNSCTKVKLCVIFVKN